MSALDAVVVGSGPNGLAAAVTLARAGLDVLVLEQQAVAGGGARTLDLGIAPGVVHDVCSAVHPLAVVSPFLRAFDLPARGVELLQPEVAYAQPLDGGRAALAYPDLDRTCDGLGRDGDAWRSLVGPLAARALGVVDVALGDHRRPPRDLGAAAAFVWRMLEQSGPSGALRFREELAPALLAGVAAHPIVSLPSLAGAGTALLLAALAHAGGWPLPRGGSGAISDALLADLRAYGGRVQTGVPVRRWTDLPTARAVLFDTSPRTLLEVAGDRLPDRVRRALEAWHPASGAAAKVDFVLSGPVPWAHDGVGAAGTVHLGGTHAQVRAAEAEVAAGRHADRPVVLTAQPAVVDASRVTAAGLRPFWAYAHVPVGSTVDVTETVTAQVERFAPGFRDVVVASRCVPAARMAEHDANLVGGDISAGPVSMPWMLARPRAAWDPYAVGERGIWLCSAAAPPGPGVHGMSGWHAARRVLDRDFGMPRGPSLRP